MGFENFQDRLRNKRAEAERNYLANQDEAWAEIKAIFTSPTYWIVAGIALLLIVAGLFTVKFVGAIRAPDTTKINTPVVFGEKGTPTPVKTNGEEAVPEENFDFSNTEQPMVGGARKEDYYTFLLLATDAGSTNTDTIMVCSYDVKNQKLNLMSIPRDTMVNVSWDIKKINSVYGMSGMSGLKKHIGKLIGFVPDFYVKVDLKAFIDAVDLIGGVDFEVPRDMNYDDPAQNLHIHFKAGMQHLTGQHAMEVVRWRKNNRSAGGGVAGYDDTGRIQTQQAFLKAALKQALSIRNWNKISGYVEIFKKDVDTDLELGNLLWFASKAMDLKEDSFSAYTIPGDYWASAWSRSTNSYQSYVTLYPRQVIQLVNESFNPYLANVTMSNLDVMSINSDGSVASSTGYVADSRAVGAPAKRSNTEAEAESPDTATEQTADPAAQTVDPAAQTADPATQITDPAAQTVDPAAQTVDPAAQTVDPAAQTVDPAAQTADPTAQTVDPAAQTVDPAAQAVDPTAQTGNTTQSEAPAPQAPADPIFTDPAVPAPVDDIPMEELAGLISGHGVTE